MPQREKDRASGMQHSSMHACAKKDGAGGKFTWGNPMDDPVATSELVMDQKDPNCIAAEEPVTGAGGEAEKTETKAPTPAAAGPPANDQTNFPGLGQQNGGHSPALQGAWAAK